MSGAFAPPLRIGFQVQAWAAYLDALVSLPNDGLVVKTGNTASVRTYSEIRNTNGIAYRIGALQVCYQRITLNFASAAALTGSWVYPAVFASAPSVVWFPIDGFVNTATPYTQIAQAHCTSQTETSATFRLGRSSVDFVSGNRSIGAAIALGDWQ